MIGPLNGRVVVVTGANRGIGSAIADRALAAGASVLAVSRTCPEGRRSEHLAGVRIDVTEPDAGERVVGAALDEFGRLDALVNNAGRHHSAPCWEQSDQDWGEMLAVNVTAPFMLATAVARRWVEASTPGVIVNVCSIESEAGWAEPPQAGYAATKGALLGVTRALALDLAQHGIRVVAVGPGVIDTDMSPRLASVAARIPLRNRFGDPAEIGDAVVFLLSDSASYVTGEILYVDGGYRLR